MKRELFWSVFLSIMLAITFPALAEYPDKAITCVVSFSAGGTTDIAARSMCDLGSKILGQPMVVLNKPGGTGSVGLAHVKKEKLDGYIIVNVAGGIFIGSLLL